MTTAIVILGGLMAITALLCIHGAILKKVIDGGSLTWSSREGISSDFREWAMLMWTILTYPFGWLNPLPKPNEKGHYSRPIILVPGYGLNRMSLIPMQIRLKNSGFKWVWIINNPILKDNLNDFSKALEKKLAWYQWRTGADKIDLIGFSMGGLVCRHVMDKCPELIGRFVSINTPWKGTKLQNIALGKQAKQMAENTEFTKFEDLPSCEHLAIVAKQDWVVLPNENLKLPNLNTVEIAHAGHMNVLFNHLAYQHILDFLKKEHRDDQS